MQQRLFATVNMLSCPFCPNSRNFADLLIELVEIQPKLYLLGYFLSSTEISAYYLCALAMWRKESQDTAPVSSELCVSVYMHVFRDLFFPYAVYLTGLLQLIRFYRPAV